MTIAPALLLAAAALLTWIWLLHRTIADLRAGRTYWRDLAQSRASTIRRRDADAMATWVQYLRENTRALDAEAQLAEATTLARMHQAAAEKHRREAAHLKGRR